jgi:hypothetical protein
MIINADYRAVTGLSSGLLAAQRSVFLLFARSLRLLRWAIRWTRTQTSSHRLKCTHTSHFLRHFSLPAIPCAERVRGNSPSVVQPALSSHRYNASHDRHSNVYTAGPRHRPPYKLLCAQLRRPSCCTWARADARSLQQRARLSARPHALYRRR